MRNISFSFFSQEDPHRMRSIVEFATNLPCLMALTTEEIRGRLEEEFCCRLARVQAPGGVITAWGELVGLEDPRTGSAFHSHDAQALLLDIGPRAEYVLDVLIRNVQVVTREEYERLLALQEAEVFQDYHQEPSFRAWIDQCAAHAEHMASPPGIIRRAIATIRTWMWNRFHVKR